MSDEQSTPNAEGDAWQEVGQQFQKVGESLAKAFRTAWEDPKTQEHVHEMKTGVEAMLQEVSQAMRDAERAATPEAQQARAEAERVFRRARAAGEQTFAEARPHLLTALRELDAALQKWLSHLESEERAGDDARPG